MPEGHVQIAIYEELTGERVATAFQRAENAALIAAAPDLFDALCQIIDDMTESHADEVNNNHNGDGLDCSYCRTIARARAAIAKAGGAQ